MSSKIPILFRNLPKTVYIQTSQYSVATNKVKLKNKGPLLISCKRKALDHYADMYYKKLDEVPLVSRGWTHLKSKGDYFTVHPMPIDVIEEKTYKFEELDINSNMFEALKKEGIKELTEFQYRAIQQVKQGSHVLLAAETGCGKTLSYLLPIVQNLIDNKATDANTPKAVVLVPNRELAHQVGEVARILGESVGVKTKVVVGGKTKSIMMNAVFEDIDILVATPGALGKLSTVGIYKLHEVEYMVLDEADTLIDDSFVDRMESLIKRVPKSQIILVSATLPKKLPPVLTPIEQTIKQVVSPRIHKPQLNITQKFLRLTKSQKPAQLLELAKNNAHPMLIFTNKNETCNWLALFLRENGVNCANINGDQNFAIRIDQWNKFVAGEAKILSSTDVGSRGLNTIQVKHVLNYDFPMYSADYLHRIGRVGRLGSPASCRVTNFVAGFPEIKMVQQIELAIRRNEAIENVDGNITNLVQRKIARRQREEAV